MNFSVTRKQLLITNFWKTSILLQKVSAKKFKRSWIKYFETNKKQQLPLTHELAFHISGAHGQPQPTWSRSAKVWKQMILLLVYCQEANSSLKLHQNVDITHLTSSQHVGIVSSHIIIIRVSTVW